MSFDNKREENVTTTTKVTTVITVRINNHEQQAQRDCQRQLLSLTVTIFYFKILSNVNATLVTDSDWQRQNTTLPKTERKTSKQSTGEFQWLYFFIRVKFDFDFFHFLSFAQSTEQKFSTPASRPKRHHNSEILKSKFNFAQKRLIDG